MSDSELAILFWAIFVVCGVAVGWALWKKRKDRG